MQTFFSRGSVSIREPFSSKFFHRLIFAVHFFNYFKFCSCCCDFFLPPSCEFCDFFAYCTHTPPDPPRTERGLYKQNNTQKKRKSVLDCWRCVFCTVWVSESEKKKKKNKNKNFWCELFSFFNQNAARWLWICRLASSARCKLQHINWQQKLWINETGQARDNNGHPRKFVYFQHYSTYEKHTGKVLMWMWKI